MQEALDLWEIKNSWEDFWLINFADNQQDKAQPAGLKKSILYIKCRNSIWVNELRFKQGFLLSRLQKRFKRIKIEQVRFYC